MTNQTLKDIDRAFKALEERDELFDNIRAEIGKSKIEHEMQIAEKDIKAKLLISDIYCDIISIIDNYRSR